MPIAVGGFLNSRLMGRIPRGSYDKTSGKMHERTCAHRQTLPIACRSLSKGIHSPLLSKYHQASDRIRHSKREVRWKF